MSLALTQSRKDIGNFLRLKRGMVTAVALWFGCGSPTTAQQAAFNPQKHLVVIIDARQTAAPVSKYEYGMFIEHIGPLIYRSLWSEMLDDHKFYFPITSKMDDQAAHQANGFRGAQLLKWLPVGPGCCCRDGQGPTVCR